MKNIISLIVLGSFLAEINAYGVPTATDPCLEISANVAVPYAGDCRKFWRCYNNKPGMLNTCTKGTYFSPMKSYCVHDASFCLITNAQNPIAMKPARPTPRTVTTKRAPETKDLVSLPGDYGICSSCNGLPEGTLVPVIGICGKFCVCGTVDSSKSIVMQSCPGGLYFNPSKHVCDWPLASGCTNWVN